MSSLQMGRRNDFAPQPQVSKGPGMAGPFALRSHALPPIPANPVSAAGTVPSVLCISPVLIIECVQKDHAFFVPGRIITPIPRVAIPNSIQPFGNVFITRHWSQVYVFELVAHLLAQKFQDTPYHGPYAQNKKNRKNRKRHRFSVLVKKSLQRQRGVERTRE